MLYREIIAVCSQIHTKHINTLCGQNVPSLNVKLCPTASCDMSCVAELVNRLTPNDPYMGRTAPLTSKRCILYIYSTNIGTEYFKHALYSPFFFLSSKCSLFHNANLFGSCIIHILYTGCAKIKKKNNSGAKRLICRPWKFAALGPGPSGPCVNTAMVMAALHVRSDLQILTIPFGLHFFISRVSNTNCSYFSHYFKYVNAHFYTKYTVFQNDLNTFYSGHRGHRT